MTKVFTDGLSFAIPLLIMAVGAIYSEKSGVTNLAIEGFQGFGAFIGALIAVLLMPVLGNGSQAVIYIAMAAAAVGGAVCVSARTPVHQVQGEPGHQRRCRQYPGGGTDHLLSQRREHRDQRNSVQQVDPRRFVEVLHSGTFEDIPWIGGLFHNMYPFEIIIIVLVLFFWYLMYKTRYGMHLRACGENPQAVDAAGGKVAKTRWIAVIISGALSGIGGICFAYSLLANYSPSIYMGYGYLAIAAMIFGNWNIGTTALVCLIFGFAKSGGYQLCIAMGLPSNYSDLFLMLPYVLTMLLLIFFSKKNHPPKAAGEPWDKGKR